MSYTVRTIGNRMIAGPRETGPHKDVIDEWGLHPETGKMLGPGRCGCRVCGKEWSEGASAPEFPLTCEPA